MLWGKGLNNQTLSDLYPVKTGFELEAFLKKFKISFVVFIFICAAYYLFAPQILERFLVVESPLGKADAIVLMAGSKNHRLPAVAELYRQGVAPRILLANDGVRGAWSVKHQRNLYMVEWAKEDLLELGVPEQSIELLDFTKSGSIYDAINTQKFVDFDGTINSLLIVTSHYHTYRTLWIFNRVFSGVNIEIGVYPVPPKPDYQGRYLRIYTTELMKVFYYLIRY